MEKPAKAGQVAPIVACPYGISPDELQLLNMEKDMDGLKARGGVEGLAKLLGTDVTSGLDPSLADGSGSIATHQEVYGKNEFESPPPVTFLALCWQTLHDPILILLCCAAVLSTILGAAIPSQRAENGWIEGVAIGVAVCLVTCVGAGNDYQKDQQFRKMNAAKDIIDTKVIRGGVQLLVPSTQVVVGDILILDTGDKLIADSIIIESFGLIVDEASLTGESDGMKKERDADCWARSGTQVSEGSGRALIVAVGPASEWGKTMALVSEAGDDATPLQLKLEDVASAIGKIGIAVAVASFIALLIKWCVVNNGFPLNKINNNGPVQFFLYSVTIIVVAVPEGLPLAVTISLAYSMKKMMKDNNFVRVLAACETMGGATAICSDKTGTLTENRMTVVEGWFAGNKLDHAPIKDELRPEMVQELKNNIALSSKAFLIDEKDGRLEFVGNRTECALLVFLRNWGLDYAKVRAECAPLVKQVYGFSSTKKMSSVLVQLPDKFRLYNKGAAEWVLRRSTMMMDEYGKTVPITGEAMEKLQVVITEMAKRGLRCIALTYADYDLEDDDRADDFFENVDDVDRGLIVMAIVGIKDPVRKEVPAAVATCQRAGIVVRMVTGDNIHTAQAIARECGILTDDCIAIEGPNFRAMSALELIPMLPKLRVLARSSPEDKLKFVSLLKQQGEVVAVTGDGTNDAPALKEADVGLAMGIAGTEVAKEAADIIILDDNFNSIVKSVLWGRSVFSNIRKFLQFQLTVNCSALVICFCGSVIGGHEPLNVLQLLWVNMIMDTMGALALATDDPHPGLLLDKPHGHTESLINRMMWKHILIQACYQLLWMFLALYGMPSLLNGYESTTAKDFYMRAETPFKLQEHFRYNTSLPVVGNNTIAATTTASYVTNVIQYCGFPVGDDFRRTASSDCWLYRDIWSNYSPAQMVPHDLRLAVCGAGTTQKCPFYEQVNSARDWMNKRLEKQQELDLEKPLSVLFNAFILMQVANEINCRRINDEYNVFQGFFKNPIFLIVIAVTVLLQVIIIQFMGLFFKVIPLNYKEWLACVAIGLGAFPVSWLTKFFSKNGLVWKRGGNKVYNNSLPVHVTRGGRTLSHERAKVVRQMSGGVR